jgi:hypothetical protein
MANVDIRVGKKNAAFFAANTTLVLKNGQFIFNETTQELFIGDGTTQLSLLTPINGGDTSNLVPYTGATQNVDLGTNDLIFGAGAGILLDNGSRLREGTIDAGFGGSKGISQICAVGYELKWEAGRLYVMDGNGVLIRHSLHNFTTAPSANDDDSKGYYFGSFWTLDDGTTYICSDSTTGAATWDLYYSMIPNLQQVTDNNSITTNTITVTDNYENETRLQQNGINFIDLDDGGNTLLTFENTSTVDQEIIVRGLSGTLALTSDIPDTSTLVPYTGATSDVDLGEYELKAGQVEFDQTPTGTSGVAVMRWNDTDGTLDLGLKGGNVTLQVGQEQVVRVVNKTATNVNLLEANYQAVRVTGAQGQRLKVDLAQATNDTLSAETIGLVTETINNNQQGFITTSGLVRGINTTGSLQGETWADGDIVYLSPTTAGNITNIKPTAPNHLVIIGYVVYAHNTQGSIYVKVDNGYELEELHNVTSTNYTTPIDTDSVLTYDVTNSIWKRLTLANLRADVLADATTADIAASTNKNYVTDAQAIVIGNTSGTNSGDVSVTDGSTIDFTLTGQALTAEVKDNSITEAKQLLADNTTNDVSTSKHGYAPKLPNNTTQFLRGDGTYASPSVSLSVQTVTSSASVTPTSNNDLVVITAQAVALTMEIPTGTPVEGQALMVRVKDNGTARGITWTSGSGGYRAIGITLPTTTVLSKTTYVGLIYNSTDSRWDAIGVTTEA